MSTPSRKPDPVPAKPGHCACELCRRGLRIRIAQAFRARRRWMGYWTIRQITGLGWVPEPFYRDVFDEMVRRGLLLAVADDGSPGGFAVYLAPAAMALPFGARKADDL